MIARGRLCGAVVLSICLASACAGRRLTLPVGPAAAFPGFAEAFAQATAACRTVQSITASLALSGRTGGNRLAGRIDTGLAAPSRIRFEFFPPMAFGRAAFVLAADDDSATLLMPRENRVLRGARPEQIVQALTGVPLGGADMRAVLAGCGLTSGTPPGEGRVYENGWVAADVDGATIYLRQGNGQWQVAGATRGAVTVQYGSYDAAGRPETVNLRTAPSADAPATDLTVKLSDVQINPALGDEVFDVQVPPDAVPLSLDELRRGMSGR
jgi:outer membrane lipoprotein-sorting protein